MGYMNRLLSGGKKSGAVHEVVETVEYAAASWGFGYLQGRFRERASIGPVPADLGVGLGLKILALAGNILGKGGKVLPHMHLIGNAGIGAYMHTHGVGAGSQKSGVKRLLVNAADVAKVQKILPDVTVLGAIPKAPPGDFLICRRSRGSSHTRQAASAVSRRIETNATALACGRVAGDITWTLSTL